MAKETPASEELSSAVLHKFLLFYRFLRHYARQMDSQGLRARDFSVLRFLLENSPVTVGQVQSYLYQSPSMTSTILAQMEDAGLVTRTRSAEDNRVVIVELTPAGYDAAQQTPMGGIPLLRRRLPALPPEKLHVLDEALTILMELMEVDEVE
jgi:DNA-binding MarR family transcriptional regulator